MASFGSLKSAIFEKEERRQQYQAHILGLNAYDRHKKFVKDYVDFYGKERNRHDMLPIKTDQDTIREGYRFIRSEEDDMDPSWEQRLVKRYYDKLFKEYCIADMTQYRNGKIGLRWRTEKEVISGKGQFICGNKQCNEKDGLASYEVNFSYFEARENKQVLVKLVACKRIWTRRKVKLEMIFDLDVQRSLFIKSRKRRNNLRKDTKSTKERGKEYRVMMIQMVNMTEVMREDNLRKDTEKSTKERGKEYRVMMIQIVNMTEVTREGSKEKRLQQQQVMLGKMTRMKILRSFSRECFHNLLELTESGSVSEGILKSLRSV